MSFSLSTSTNSIWVRNLMCLMDGAIHCGEIELLLNDSSRTEKRIQLAKKAYWNALRFAGRVSFNAREVSLFESKSIRLERIIRELQERHNIWKKLSGQPAVSIATSD